MLYGTGLSFSVEQYTARKLGVVDYGRHGGWGNSETESYLAKCEYTVYYMQSDAVATAVKLNTPGKYKTRTHNVNYKCKLCKENNTIFMQI